MIAELTDAQKEELKIWHDRWHAIGTSTTRIDRDKARKLFTQIYKLADHKPPHEIVFCESPFDALNKINAQQVIDGKQSVDEKKYYDTYLWGSFDSYWAAFYLYCEEVLAIKYDTQAHNKLHAMGEIAQNSFWWWAFDTHCFVSEKPILLNLNERKQLHSTTQAAIQFSDGWSVYAINGRQVPEKIIMRPEEITIEEIEAESNVEIRRLMTEQYDRNISGRYIKDSGATLLSQHEYNGLTYFLYRKEQPNDEPMVMVKMTNATKEWKGSFKTVTKQDEDGRTYTMDEPAGDGEWVDKEYWQRVPPTITCSKQAIAWTFDETEETYKPDIET